MKPTQETLCFHAATFPFTDHDLISDLLSLPAEKVHETLANYSLRDLGTMTEHELRQAGLTPARALELKKSPFLAWTLILPISAPSALKKSSPVSGIKSAPMSVPASITVSLMLVLENILSMSPPELIRAESMLSK